MIKLKISHVLVVLLVCLSTLSSSQQFLDIAHPGRTTPLPAIPEITLYACESSPTNYSTTIDNFSPFVLTNISFTYKLPAGIIYAGNFSGGSIATGTSPNESTVIVTIDSLVSNQVVTISFDIRAGCGVYQFGSTGGSFNVNMDGVFTQKSNSVVYTRNYTFAPLVVNYPELQMSNWSYKYKTNVNYDRFNPKIKDTVDRRITIVNGGTSRLDSVYFNSVHSSSLRLLSYRTTSASLTVASTGTATNHRIVLDSAQFATVGNGDGFLDPGERFIMSETVIIGNCNDPNTDYSVSWGCGANICQAEIDETRLVFPASSPKLIVSTIIDTVLCKSFNTGAIMGLRIQNVAPNNIDSAKDVSIDISQGWNGFNNNMLSVINVNSIAVREVGTGNLIPFTLVSTNPNNSAVCNAAGSNSIGKFKINIDKIYSGQDIAVRWKVFSCYNSNCYNGYRHELNWNYNLTYKNRCEVTYTEHLNKNALSSFDIVHDMSEQALQHLRLQLSGKSDLKNLRHVESVAPAISLVGTPLFCGMYLNELTNRIMPNGLASEGVYHAYEEGLTSLLQGDDIEVALRKFEFALLDEMGLLPDFTTDIEYEQPILPNCNYRFQHDTGFVCLPAEHENSKGLPGEALMSLAHGEFTPLSKKVAKVLCRDLLKPLIGDKPLKSRELFVATTKRR